MSNHSAEAASSVLRPCKRKAMDTKAAVETRSFSEDESNGGTEFEARPNKKQLIGEVDSDTNGDAKEADMGLTSETCPTRKPGQFITPERVSKVKSRSEEFHTSVKPRKTNKPVDRLREKKESCVPSEVGTNALNTHQGNDSDDDDDAPDADPFSFRPRTPKNDSGGTAAAKDTTTPPVKKEITANLEDEDADDIVSSILTPKGFFQASAWSSVLKSNRNLEESDDEDYEYKPQEDRIDESDQNHQDQEHYSINKWLNSDDEDDEINLTTMKVSGDVSCDSDTLEAIRLARQAREELSPAQLVDASTVTAQAEEEAKEAWSLSVSATPSPQPHDDFRDCFEQPTQAVVGRSIYVTLRCRLVGACTDVEVKKEKYNFRVNCSDAVQRILETFRRNFSLDNPQMEIERLAIHFDGRPMQEERTLQSYDLEDDDLLDILVTATHATQDKLVHAARKGKPIVLMIRSNVAPDSSCSKKEVAIESFELRFLNDDIVRNLVDSYKKRFTAENPQLQLQRVVLQFDGESLSEHRTLKSYDLQKDDLIDAIVTLGGKETTADALEVLNAAESKEGKGRPIELILDTSIDAAFFTGKSRYSFRIRSTDKVQKLLDSYRESFSANNPQFHIKSVFLMSSESGETLEEERSIGSYGFEDGAEIPAVVSTESESLSVCTKASHSSVAIPSSMVNVTLRTAIDASFFAGRELYSFQVHPTDKVKELVATYKGKFAEENPRLTIRGVRLLVENGGWAEEDETIESSGLTKTGKAYAFVETRERAREKERSPLMQLKLRTHLVSTPSGRESRHFEDCSVEVKPTDKIQLLISRYREQFRDKIRIQNIMMKRRGERLLEKRILASYCIGGGDVIDVMVLEVPEKLVKLSAASSLSESARKWLEARGLA